MNNGYEYMLPSQATHMIQYELTEMIWPKAYYHTPVGGVILCCCAKMTTELNVLSDGQMVGKFLLPACSNDYVQLFALNQAVEGEHAISIQFDARNIQINWMQLCPQADMVVGINPIIGVDMPDPDIIRVGDVYYMASTTMHLMPGCTLLRSYDLIQWEIAGYAYDRLPETPGRNLEDGQHAYGKGMWAPTLRYHRRVFHLCFSANDTHTTYHYQATSIEGPWQLQVMDDFFYDCSLFFDDDDRAYMVHGNNRVMLTELNESLTAAKPGGLHRLLLEYGKGPLGYEGSHLYKHEGQYVLFSIHSNHDYWYREESCFTAASLSDPFVGGVILHDDMGYHDQGVAQGGMVDTPDGRWYVFLFQDRGASGRIPVLTPMRWENGRPVIGVDGKLPVEVCNLSTKPGYRYMPFAHSDDFTKTQLSPAWQWNHHPNLDYVAFGAGCLRLTTNRISAHLLQTHNLLTQRTTEPTCDVRVTVDVAAMHVGDTAGLCIMQSRYAWIGLRKQKEGYELVANVRHEDDNEAGREVFCERMQGASATLRILFDFADMHDTATLYAIQDGKWRKLCDSTIYFKLDHFVGNRVGLFAMSAKQTGGTAVFTAFRLNESV